MSKDAGLVAGTRSYYKSGIRRFGKWVRDWRKKSVFFRFLCPSEVALCFFVVTLSSLLVPGTIRNYLFGIRDYHVGRGFPNPLAGADRLWRIMGFLFRACGEPKTRRRPITVHTLGVLFKFVDFSTHIGRTFWSMLTNGVYGLLRIGELTPKRDRFKPRTRHWREGATLAVLKLPKTKTEQLKSVKIIFTAVENWSCPVSSTRYMLRHSPLPSEKSSFLWRTEEGRPVGRDDLISFVRARCVDAGLSPDDYNGISLRKGGALSLSLAGVDEQVIRAMGRWKGAVVDRYIDSVVSVVRKAHTAAGTLWSASGESERFTADDLWDRLE
jgi:hypothetical protein